MLLLSAANRIRLQKLLVIILSWMAIAVVMSVYDHTAYRSDYVENLSSLYGFEKNLFFNLGGALLGSIMGGVFLVYYINERYRERPYGQTILMVAISFIVVIAIITLLLGIVDGMWTTGKPLTDPEAMAEFRRFVTDPMHLKNAVWWAPIVGLTQFALQINDKFGQGILWNFLRGRYQHPKEEMRVFMFVDLVSSTSIAEQLGNEKYHSLLKDFFADITNAILYNKGEIYQYVGDEIVISWKMHRGIQNNHCLQCFFDMWKAVQKEKIKYQQKYGLVPDFKAGLHYGKVIAGEVGIIKRDITFSGDVLNTASRIQGKCNEYQVKILSSDDLLELMPYQDSFNRISIGAIELKGKGRLVSLSTLQVKN
jgi:adenylate cyclase